jgi:hypothetical protein
MLSEEAQLVVKTGRLRGVWTMRLMLLLALTIGLVTTLSAEIEVNGQKIKKGDVNVNSWTGTFVSNLDGDYTIVVSADYDSREMNATIIDNVTNKITCVPNACNYTN